jgi:hypothetical protein
VHQPNAALNYPNKLSTRILQVLESVYHVPTPKQPCTPPHESSRDDRLRIYTLYYDAKWIINDIIL